MLKQKSIFKAKTTIFFSKILTCDPSIYTKDQPDFIVYSFMENSIETVLGHFGLGCFGLDISATDVSATENAEGGRFGHNHRFWDWDVCMHKGVMHFTFFF